jgi:hypothetical protein
LLQGLRPFLSCLSALTRPPMELRGAVVECDVVRQERTQFLGLLSGRRSRILGRLVNGLDTSGSPSSSASSTTSVLGYSEGERPLPADFGVRLTRTNVDAHIARARSALAAWASGNSDLVVPIVRAAQTLKTLNRQGEVTCW